MPPPKQSNRQGSIKKRPHESHHKKRNDGPPPSKKARKTPLAPSTSLSTSNPPSTTTAQSHHQSTSTLPPVPPPAQSPLAPPILSALLTSLQKTHDLTTQSIISSSSIQTKVTRVLEILSVYPTPVGEKPRVVCLYAKAACASKLVSVVEIAKREIGRVEGKWFAYCAVEGVMSEKGARQTMGSKKGTGEQESGGDGDVDVDGKEAREDEEEESTAFETMKTPFERANEGRAQVRAVPVMRIFLSKVRIEGFRSAYGEQTNALPVQKERK